MFANIKTTKKGGENMKQKGFTLVELLVVIVIIGILATLATVALSSARVKARDARRVSDVKQLQTALELYYNDHLYYPPSGEVSFSDPTSALKSQDGNVTYMAAIPSDPDSNDCDDHDSAYNGYKYASISTDSSIGYGIKYCLGTLTGQVDGGIHCASLKGLAAEGTISSLASTACVLSDF